MLQDIFISLRDRGLLKWLVAGFAVILAAILISIILQPGYTRHSLTDTPFKASGTSFVHLDGSHIYSYNGAAFYKINVDAPDDITILSGGVKLPVPSNIVWAGDRGALMNFRESFTLTAVDRALQRADENLTESAMAYTWYFDFESESVHKVSEKPLVAGLAKFSPADNGFYYVPDLFFTPLSEAGDDFVDETPLHFYDIDAKRDREVTGDLNLVDISSISPCHDSSRYQVCIVARDEDDITNVRLFAINQEGQKEVLLESDSRLVPTNRPELFVTTPAIPYDDEDDHDEDEDEEHTHRPGEYDVPADISPGPATLHNLAAGTSEPLGFDIGGEGIIAYFTSDEDFYLLNDESASLSRSVYHSGARSIFGNLTTREFPLQFDDGTSYGNGFVNLPDYGDNGTVLLTSARGDMMLFSPRKSDFGRDLSRLSGGESEETVKYCIESRAESYQYFSDADMFRVFFTHDNSFNRNLRGFTECLADRNASVFIGNNFYFGALDSDNGRIVTD
jgi:hypothetical protein